MPYNGLEIDMLALGDADSILFTRWENGAPVYTLIDGGEAKDTEVVREFLANRKINRIHNLVNSHLHDDHVEGLVGLVQDTTLTFDRAWLHRPELHVDMDAVEKALAKTADLKESKLITASIKTQRELVLALNARKISITEPFEGKKIDVLTVCGPSEAFYKELLKGFKDVDMLRTLNEERDARDRQPISETLAQVFSKTAATRADLGLLKSPKTDPENDSSTILTTVFEKQKLLFTADAGAKALTRAVQYAGLTACHWMQIPHHGSRNNITQTLLDRFSPKITYISAEGNDHHPHPAVVKAFKAVGAGVYSTHYPTKRHLRYHIGNVPVRGDYTAATPL